MGTWQSQLVDYQQFEKPDTKAKVERDMQIFAGTFSLPKSTTIKPQTKSENSRDNVDLDQQQWKAVRGLKTIDSLTIWH